MQSRFYQFDEFCIDVAARQLYRDGVPVATLPGRLFHCVVHLIEHRERAVGRDELIAVVWEREDSGDNLLGQLIVRARRLFNDTGDEQRVIRTVPSFGYQWVASVQAVESFPCASAVAESAPDADGCPIEPAVAPPARVPDPRASRRWRIWATLACLVLVGSGAAWWMLRPLQPTVALNPSVRITVAETLPLLAERPALILPAIVASGSGQDWLRMGIMALINERLELAGQAVVPSDNVAALTRGLDIAALGTADYAALADTAVAGWIVQTRVGPVGPRWRVTLAVVHGEAPKSPLQFSVDADEPLDAARAVADQMIAALVPDRAPLAASGEAEALAFVLKKAEAAYLDGDPAAAAALLSAARSRHPDSAELDYQLAWMEFKSGRFAEAEAGLRSLASRLATGNDAVATARALNGLANLALVRGDQSGLEDYSRQVIELLQTRQPDSVEIGRAWLARAIAASIAGRYESAFVDYARARARLAAANNWLGVAHVDAGAGTARRQQGNIEEAGAQLERAAERLGLFSEVGDEAIVRTHLARTELDRVDPAAALAQEPRLSALAQRMRWEHVRTLIDLTRADVLLANGRLADARPLLERAYQQAMAAPQIPNRYQAHSIAARLAWEENDPERARREAALAIAAVCDGDVCANGDGRDLAYLHLLLARLQARTDLDAAKETRAQLLRRMTAQKSGYVDIYVRLIDAELSMAREDFVSAKAAFESALSNTDSAPIDLLRIAATYVPWLIARAESDRAEVVVARLADMRERDFGAAVIDLRVRHARGPQAAWQASLRRATSLAGERTLQASLRSAPTAASGFID